MPDADIPRGLRRLVYHSRFSASFPRSVEDQDYEIGRIIRSSIRNNRMIAVTGMLLVHGDSFLQVLEGPDAAVRATYQRILADNRHIGARLLTQLPAERRLFSDWNMCAHRLSKADDAILDTMEKGLALDLGSLGGERALKLLTAVRDVQAKTLARGLV